MSFRGSRKHVSRCSQNRSPFGIETVGRAAASVDVHRYLETEPRPLARLGLNLEIATVCRCQPLGEITPEPDPRRPLSAVKPLEYSRYNVDRHAGPFVAHLEHAQLSAFHDLLGDEQGDRRTAGEWRMALLTRFSMHWATRPASAAMMTSPLDATWTSLNGVDNVFATSAESAAKSTGAISSRNTP